ncbi:MAG: histidine kinase, partial [Bacteroidota bacterium]
MDEIFNKKFMSIREVFFQVALHLLVFTFYSFDKNDPQFEFHHVVFFFNYALANFSIAYLLLPLFYYRKKYLQFFVFALLTIAGVILIEELILEKIYFPNTRGTSFPG